MANGSLQILFLILFEKSLGNLQKTFFFFNVLLQGLPIVF